MQENPWTPERIIQLTELQPHNTTSTIAEIMSTTKNSIIGKIRRLGLPPRTNPAPHNMNAGAGQGMPNPPITKIKYTPRPADMPLVPLVDLGNGCLWPYGDPQDKDFGFCGQERAEDAPYCPEHCTRGYIKNTKNKMPKWRADLAKLERVA